MSLSHGLEALLVRASLSWAGSGGWRRSLARGAALGRLVGRLGIRRRLARSNLARAFPDWSEPRRREVLDAHYEELGRVFVEYGRLPELARAAHGEVIAEVRGLEHLERAREAGRGAILLTGHFGHFELFGAWAAHLHAMDVVVKPLSNPRVEAIIDRMRAECGLGTIPIGSAMRGAFRALRNNRWVAMLADQDARSHGVFVPFFGIPSSTATGPARLSLATGAPIIMGAIRRRPDGRHTAWLEPPLEIDVRPGEDAVERLTALHAARLEAWIRECPEAWFWLHRRWKTAPPRAAKEA